MPDEQEIRRPLTGFLRVEWVDAGDPNDVSATANFGWFSFTTDPPLEAPRLLALLHRLAESVQEDIDNGDDGPRQSEGRLPE